MSNVNFVEDGSVDQGEALNPFPAYYKAVASGVIVLFTDANTGTVVAEGGPWNIGFHSKTWIDCTDKKYWTPCDKPDITPKPLEFKGTPVWAIVSDYSDGWNTTGFKGRVVAQGEGWYYAVADGNDEFNAITVLPYLYAWEIPNGEDNE